MEIIFDCKNTLAQTQLNRLRVPFKSWNKRITLIMTEQTTAKMETMMMNASNSRNCLWNKPKKMDRTLLLPRLWIYLSYTSQLVCQMVVSISITAMIRAIDNKLLAQIRIKVIAWSTTKSAVRIKSESVFLVSFIPSFFKPKTLQITNNYSFFFFLIVLSLLV